MVMNSFENYLIRHVKSNDNNKEAKIQAIRAVMARAAHVILRWLPHIRVSSQTKEIYSAICDDDTNPLKFDVILEKRFQIQSQKLQHQYPDDWTFPIPTICPVFNFMSPCKDKKCQCLL